MKDELFMIRFEEFIKKEGFSSSREFINKWISDGSTFRNLHQRLNLMGLEVSYVNIWLKLRPLLTVPYQIKDGLWYKWDGIAKTKGFSGAEEMFKVYFTTKTLKQIAEELGITYQRVKNLATTLNEQTERLKDSPDITKRKRKMLNRGTSGIKYPGITEKWKEKLKEKGYTSLEEAVNALRTKGLSHSEMAEFFEMSPKGLYLRMNNLGLCKKRGGIKKIKIRRRGPLEPPKSSLDKLF